MASRHPKKNFIIVTIFYYQNINSFYEKRRQIRSHLWWKLESIMADSSRAINVGVVDGGQKPHVGRLEWVATKVTTSW